MVLMLSYTQVKIFKIVLILKNPFHFNLQPRPKQIVIHKSVISLLFRLRFQFRLSFEPLIILEYFQ